MNRLLLLILLLIAVQPIIAQDTISLYVDTVCQNFMPLRTTVATASKTGGGTKYLDSIRVCGTIVDAHNKDYYLKVYDKDSVIRMEGYFHDQYAKGHCIYYDRKGRKTSEGEYEMIVKRRFTSYKKKGDWKYYNTAGVLIRTEKE